MSLLLSCCINLCKALIKNYGPSRGLGPPPQPHEGASDSVVSSVLALAIEGTSKT